MPARHRRNPKTQEVRHRVYHLPEELRDLIHERRQKRGQTVQEFLRMAVDDELSRLVDALIGLGIKPCSDPRAAKLPLDDRLLGDLKVARDATGIPQTQLLLSCLRISGEQKAEGVEEGTEPVTAPQRGTQLLTKSA